MAILITGAGGFVGRHLIERLLEAGESIVALDRDVTTLAPHARLKAFSGDIADRDCRAQALAAGCSKLIHLATVPGGTAEADPAASRQVNLDASYDLLLEAAEASPGLRVVFASSIAVLGEPLPREGVTEATPVAPRLIYGGHKAMIETAVAMMSRRGAIDGVSLRLPGILARPEGPSGMKSAFMSDLFHALREARPYRCPVSTEATIWAQSLDQCGSNFLHALAFRTEGLPASRALFLPPLRIRLGTLVEEIARQCRVPPSLVSFDPEPGLEAAFGSYPPISVPLSQQSGFLSDPSIEALVARVLRRLGARS